MPNSTAKFYYRSFIDQDIDGYTLSGDFTPTTNVNDRRKDTYASTDSTGSGDGTSEEIVCDLLTERTIDTIFLKSNFKAFTIYYWEDEATGSTGGGDWYELATYAANAEDFLAISFTAVSTSQIKIVATDTIVANEIKKIYLLEITKYIDELPIEEIDIKQEFEREQFKNIYGGSIQIVEYPNQSRVEINLSWENMPAATWAIYSQLKSLGLIDAYLIYLYFSDSYDLLNDEALYLVNDVAEKGSKPSAPTLAAGVSGKMKLLEC
jgi:hypothetical protein